MPAKKKTTSKRSASKPAPSKTTKSAADVAPSKPKAKPKLKRAREAKPVVQAQIVAARAHYFAEVHHIGARIGDAGVEIHHRFARPVIQHRAEAELHRSVGRFSETETASELGEHEGRYTLIW